MKNYKFFILSLVCILLVSLSLKDQIKNLQNFNNYELDWPELEIPELELFNQEESQKEKTYKDFISPDKKLSFKYGSDWIEIDSEYLEEISAQSNEENNEYNTKVLFLAQKIIPDSGLFVQLVVNEAYWKIENGLEEIIQKVKTDIKSGWKMDVIKSDITENKAYFEAIYEHENSSQLYSKEKILFDGQEKYFLIEFFAFEQSWQQFEKEVNEIFDSIQVNF